MREKNMNRRRVIDILLVLSAVALLGVVALFLKPAVSADTVAFVKLSALNGAGCSGGCDTSPGDPLCRSCTARTGDLLHSRNGIAWIKVDAATKHLVIAYDSHAIDPGSISETITRSGYVNNVARTMNLMQFNNAPEGRSGKLLRHSPCGGACWNGKSKGEVK